MFYVNINDRGNDTMEPATSNRISVTDPSSLGQAIRQRRQRLGLLQSELAMQSGVSSPTVSAIENGKETARIGLVLQLCKDLGLNLTAEI
jgi:y4mF family transcriptional regulator